MNIFGGYNARYALTHPWVMVSNAYRQTKWFIQRGIRGYADCDVWNLHDYLTGWLPEALKGLKNNTRNGYPMGLKGRGEWEKLLGKMVQGFNANKKIINLEFDVRKKGWRKVYAKLNKQSNEGRLVFHKHFNSLWD